MPRDRRRMDYLRDRAERRGRSNRGRDRGYYPMDDYDYAPERNRERYTRRSEYRNRDENYPMEYEQPRERYRMYDYDMRDYRRNRDYADDDYDKEYEEDLHKWIEKLKRKDRFGLSKDQVIQKAKEMRVEFKDFDEEEFYAIYLMQVSDYPSISNDSRMYLSMAKSWLEDDDIAVDPSEKVCKYLYEIVMPEED